MFCEHGYTGYNWEADWDECWNTPGLNGGTCQDGIAHFNCSCLLGFSGLQSQVNVDDCLSEPYLNDATCQDGMNDYSCQCLPSLVPKSLFQLLEGRGLKQGIG